MALDDPVETETPIFTEEEVYAIVGYIAELLGIDVENDIDTVIEATERAVQSVLSRTK